MRTSALHLRQLATAMAGVIAPSISLVANAWAAKKDVGTHGARIDACVTHAAHYHGVNGAVLRAILRVESNFNPAALGRNADGTLDVGIAQINSRHFARLARHGIHPEHLMDGCVGVYVAAWHLSTLIAAHGNSWTAIARYHSATPSFNHRYQLLLARQLRAAGAIQQVPPPSLPVRRDAGGHPRAGVDAGPMPPAVVFDDPAASFPPPLAR